MNKCVSIAYTRSWHMVSTSSVFAEITIHVMLVGSCLRNIYPQNEPSSTIVTIFSVLVLLFLP